MIQVRVLHYLVTQGFSLPQSMTHHINIYTFQLCHGGEAKDKGVSPKHTCSGPEMTYHFPFARLLRVAQPSGKGGWGI